MKVVIKLSIIFFIFVSVNIISKPSLTDGTNNRNNKKVLDLLTSESLKGDDLLNFINEYVIDINDGHGDGIVTYYFEESYYKRYKGLNFISEGKWSISKFDFLKLSNNKEKKRWKIKIGKQNLILIKKGFTLTGKIHEFSYKDKTDFYIKLQEKNILN